MFRIKKATALIILVLSMVAFPLVVIYLLTEDAFVKSRRGDLRGVYYLEGVNLKSRYAYLKVIRKMAKSVGREQKVNEIDEELRAIEKYAPRWAEDINIGRRK